MDGARDDVTAVARKISRDGLNELILSKVKVTKCVLGQGSYGMVYKAEYNGIACAVKQVDGTHDWKLVPPPKQVLVEQYFLLECLQHSKLSHSNIVKMLGVFYPKRKSIPVLVMELMDCNLTQLLERTHNIIMFIKLSILQDISRGLCYLHTQKPPIVHQALYSDNILITKGLLVKIGDFKTGANMVSEQALLSTRPSKDKDFLPCSVNFLKYDMPLNVFSFGCIVCHVMTQKWPNTQKIPFIVFNSAQASHNIVKASSTQASYLTSKASSTQASYLMPKASSTQASYLTPKANSTETSYLFRKGNSKLASYQDPKLEFNCLSNTLDDWSIEKHHDYIDLISDSSLKQLTEVCLQRNPKNRPHISLIYESITSLMTDHCNDDNIKKAYSLAMKQGLDQYRNFQLFLVGAENTGKTNLISTFLGEEFLEVQLATEGIDVKLCKVDYENWIRIYNSEKSNILHNLFSDQCKGNVLRTMTASSVPPLPVASSYTRSAKKSSITHSSVLFTTVPLTDSMIAVTHNSTSGNSFKPHRQNVQEANLKSTQYNSNTMIASLWDFAGQVIFHNSHSIFISNNGVTVIVFNASMNITDKIIPREGCPQPYECCTIISSIHYWLQVVNSVCSVKENVLLVGTHIDKLHPDLEEARKIANQLILPVLVKELCGKPYAQHLAGISEGLRAALEHSCFFVSNKYRDEEIVKLKTVAARVAASLRQDKPIYFLKIEQALIQLNKQVISVSTMLDLVAKTTFTLDVNSPEFKGILKYFHNNRTILHFNQIESLKDLVILSPNWLAKLFSYITAAESYNIGGEFDRDWERLTNYGILHECLILHMLEKFHLEYPDLVQVTKQQAIDILLCFHLLARITSKAWFAEEGFSLVPENGDTFIVPSLVRADDNRNPPETDQERIIYFKFNNGFIPLSLLNQLIAECICRSVSRNDRLFWLRRGKMGSQLGADQKYYISRCEEKQSIQLTITVVGDDKDHIEERRNLINDVINLLDEIMKVFMPATKKGLSLLIPCPFCSVLHIPLDDARSGKAIFCPIANDNPLPRGYYRDLFHDGLSDATITVGVDKKLEVFTTYYSKLIHLNFKSLCPALITARIISIEDNEIVQQAIEPSISASRILDTISASLQGGTDAKFDKFLSVLENHSDIFCTALAEQIKRGLLSSTTVATSLTLEPARCQDHKNSYEGTTAVTSATIAGMPKHQDGERGITENHQQSQGVSCKCCNLM